MQASNLAQAGHGFFALAHSINMHGRAAAIVSSIGDKKRLFRADSVVSSSGCAGRDRVKSGSSRKNKWKHARLQGAQRREGVCVGLGCRGAECDFACFLVGRPRDLGANGDGAPPQAHIHLNLEDTPSGSPPTKFGVFVTVCNRRFQPEQPIFGARPNRRLGRHDRRGDAHIWDVDCVVDHVW